MTEAEKAAMREALKELFSEGAVELEQEFEIGNNSFVTGIEQVSIWGRSGSFLGYAYILSGYGPIFEEADDVVKVQGREELAEFLHLA